KRELERDMTVNQLLTGLSSSNFATPEEVAYLLALTGQTRDFNYAQLDISAVEGEVSLSDEEIAAYYEANPQAFAEPAKVAVELIELSVDKLIDAESVSDSELREEYQRYVDAFEASIVRRAAHILLDPTETDKIAEVEAALAEGQDFATLAETYSEDLGSSDNGGDLGVTTGDAFP